MNFIGDEAFYGTAWYDSQPDGIVYAGMVAYKYKGTMPGNTEIALKDGTLGIAESAFNGCIGLTSIVIPESVTEIGGSAFYGCSGLTSIVVESGNTVYDSRDNCNALIETTTNTLIQGCNNSFIPDGVTSIGIYAFYGCSGLTSITIPNSVTEIGEGAFSGCRGLTSVTIPNSVTTIGKYAFSGCSSLTSITIPKNVTKIGGWAFAYCTGLEEICCLSEETPEVGEDTFYGMDVSNVLLIVPEDATQKYKAHPIWGQFIIKKTTGVRTLGTEERNTKAVYDLSGRQQTNIQRGLNIIRTADGHVRRVMVK